MDFGTTRRHLARAIQLLAAAEGSVIDRLRSAHDQALRHVAPNTGLPERLQPAFEALMTALEDLVKQSPADEGRARRLAAQVVKLYQRLLDER